MTFQNRDDLHVDAVHIEGLFDALDQLVTHDADKPIKAIVGIGRCAWSAYADGVDGSSLQALVTESEKLEAFVEGAELVVCERHTSTTTRGIYSLAVMLNRLVKEHAAGVAEFAGAA